MRTLNESYDTSEDGPWSPRSIFLHSESSQLAEKIVIGAGLDPATATANDLTFARPVIECPYVPWDFPGRIFVTWPAALTHNLTVKEEILFTVNRFGEETSRIRVQEPLNIFTEIACCMHCHEESTPHRLPRHLNTMHGVEVQYPNTATGLYKLFQTHWYWNPRSNLDLIGMEFRCE
ncbi:hypothetical protein F5877DRAFT_86799 [Lentinula edodes]|nr:hypothetical protein F5877DRAFT_86799 [Lentinula edodes]